MTTARLERVIALLIADAQPQSGLTRAFTDNQGRHRFQPQGLENDIGERFIIPGVDCTYCRLHRFRVREKTVYDVGDGLRRRVEAANDEFRQYHADAKSERSGICSVGAEP